MNAQNWQTIHTWQVVASVSGALGFALAHYGGVLAPWLHVGAAAVVGVGVVLGLLSESIRKSMDPPDPPDRPVASVAVLPSPETDPSQNGTADVAIHLGYVLAIVAAVAWLVAVTSGCGAFVRDMGGDAEYANEQVACVDTYAPDKTEIDACRARVRARYGDGGSHDE